MIRILALLALIIPAPLAAQDQAVSTATMTMTGTARVTAEPDSATLHAVIAASDPNAQKALSIVKARIANLSKALAPFGAVKASRIVIGQNREKGKRLLGSDDATYFARSNLALTLTDQSREAPALDVFGAGSITGVVTFEYNVADHAPLQKQAREEAVADAIERAQTYATAANLTLGPILYIEETQQNSTGQHQGTPYNRKGSLAYGKGWTAGPTAISVSVAVTIKWRVE